MPSLLHLTILAAAFASISAAPAARSDCGNYPLSGETKPIVLTVGNLIGPTYSQGSPPWWPNNLVHKFLNVNASSPRDSQAVLTSDSISLQGNLKYDPFNGIVVYDEGGCAQSYLFPDWMGGEHLQNDPGPRPLTWKPSTPEIGDWNILNNGNLAEWRYDASGQGTQAIKYLACQTADPNTWTLYFMTAQQPGSEIQMPPNSGFFCETINIHVCDYNNGQGVLGCYP